MIFVGISSQIHCNLSEFEKFMKNIQYLSLAIGLYNIIINFSVIMNIANISSSYQFNVTGVFGNRNQFGAFMFIAIISHFYYNCIKKADKIDIFIYFIQFINLLLSMSRGALLATISFMIIYLVVYKKILVRYPILVILFIGLIVILVTNKNVHLFMERNLLRLDIGTNGRIVIWNIGLKIITSSVFSMLFGNGYYSGIQIGKKYGMKVNQFHNYFIDILVGGGIFELIITLSLFIGCFVFVKKCFDNKLKKVFYCSIFSYFILCFVESESILSIGYVDVINTIFFISMPIILGNLLEPKTFEVT